MKPIYNITTIMIKSKYRNSENVEYEMLHHTSNHWGQCN
jgi:hypothetical protein